MSNAWWEPLDVQKDYFGVFESEGCSPEPHAIFQDEESANEWVKDNEGGDDGPHEGFYTVLPVRGLYRCFAWNSFEKPTEHDAEAIEKKLRADERRADRAAARARTRNKA